MLLPSSLAGLSPSGYSQIAHDIGGLIATDAPKKAVLDPLSITYSFLTAFGNFDHSRDARQSLGLLHINLACYPTNVQIVQLGQQKPAV